MKPDKKQTELSGFIARYAEEIKDYKDKKLHDVAFTAKRVKMGVYQERMGNTCMCRIRCSANIITPAQMEILGDLADTYGDSRIHITTRSEIQLHGILLEDTVEVLKKLEEGGLSSIGGGGHTIRNIITNHDSGVHPEEEFDVQPYALALAGQMLAEPDSLNLPRKVKIGFSSLLSCHDFCLTQDIGFVAVRKNGGKHGFRVYAGGGLGAKPYIGFCLRDFIPAGHAYPAVKAIKNIYHRFGNRKNKHHSRLRFLIFEDLGKEKFTSLFEKEFLTLLNNEDCLSPDIPIIDNEANQTASISVEPLTDPSAGFEDWEKTYVTAQKQAGLFSVKLNLPLGDMSSSDCRKLSELTKNFGENALRCSSDQNLYIRNIPKRFLPGLHAGLQELSTPVFNRKFKANLIPCTGAQTCQVGINYPRPLATAIFEHFERSGIELSEIADLRVHISGCPNSCANHWIADLGFYGKVRRIGGHPIPTYTVVGGANLNREDRRLAQNCGWVHSRDLPAFLTTVFNRYIEFKKSDRQNASFSIFWEDTGQEYIKTLCKEKYNQVPLFEEDKNYYFDHGATEIFSTKDLGKAECSAGIYDMIEVDRRAIQSNLSELKRKNILPENITSVLQETLFFASRMLLVTRGEEANSLADAAGKFIRHFIDTALLDEMYRNMLETVPKSPDSKFIENEENIILFSNAVISLYEGMDQTMKFPGEVKKDNCNVINFSELKSIENGKEKPDRFKDLRGVRCPLNFAKTKVQMAVMNPGETIEIFLDDGEPIRNVPGSVRLEGHHILAEEKIDDYWRVVIEKA